MNVGEETSMKLVLKNEFMQLGLLANAKPDTIRLVNRAPLDQFFDNFQVNGDVKIKMANFDYKFTIHKNKFKLAGKMTGDLKTIMTDISKDYDYGKLIEEALFDDYDDYNHEAEMRSDFIYNL